MTKFFKGLYTAQITPFKDGKLDLYSFEKLIERQVEAKVDGIVVAGSTGEVSTLEPEEYKLLLETARKKITSSTQLIAGVSANTPPKAIKNAKIADDAGVDALMCVMPYYNKPPQRGLIHYFESIHEASSVPIMLYSVPSRTGVDFADNTIIELSKLPRIRGLKDSSNELERPLRIYGKLPSNFSLLSGEDSTCVAFSSHGGVGCVSVISNIAPKISKRLQDHLLSSDYNNALSLQSKLISLYKAIFVETNPIPIKFASSYLGLSSAEVRSPLIEMTDKNLMDNIITQLNEKKSELDLS